MLNLNSHSLVDWPALQTFCWLGYVPQKRTFGDSWSRFITGQMAFMSANHVDVVKGIIWLCQRFESVNRCSVSTWHLAGFYGMNLCRLFIVLVLTVKLTAVTRNYTKADRSLLWKTIWPQTRKKWHNTEDLDLYELLMCVRVIMPSCGTQYSTE